MATQEDRVVVNTAWTETEVVDARESTGASTTYKDTNPPAEQEKFNGSPMYESVEKDDSEYVVAPTADEETSSLLEEGEIEETNTTVEEVRIKYSDAIESVATAEHGEEKLEDPLAPERMTKGKPKPPPTATMQVDEKATERVDVSLTGVGTDEETTIPALEISEDSRDAETATLHSPEPMAGSTLQVDEQVGTGVQYMFDPAEVEAFLQVFAEMIDMPISPEAEAVDTPKPDAELATLVDEMDSQSVDSSYSWVRFYTDDEPEATGQDVMAPIDDHLTPEAETHAPESITESDTRVHEKATDDAGVLRALQVSEKNVNGSHSPHDGMIHEPESTAASKTRTDKTPTVGAEERCMDTLAVQRTSLNASEKVMEDSHTLEPETLPEMALPVLETPPKTVVHITSGFSKPQQTISLSYPIFNFRNATSPSRHSWARDAPHNNKYIQVVAECTNYANGFIIADNIPPHHFFKFFPSAQKLLYDHQVIIPTAPCIDDDVLSSILHTAITAAKENIAHPVFNLGPQPSIVSVIKYHCVLDLFEAKKWAEKALEKLWVMFGEIALSLGEVMWIWDAFGVNKEHWEYVAPSGEVYLAMMAWQILSLDAEDNLGLEIREMIKREKEPRHFRAIVERRLADFGLQPGMLAPGVLKRKGDVLPEQYPLPPSSPVAQRRTEPADAVTRTDSSCVPKFVPKSFSERLESHTPESKRIKMAFGQSGSMKKIDHNRLAAPNNMHALETVASSSPMQTSFSSLNGLASSQQDVSMNGNRSSSPLQTSASTASFPPAIQSTFDSCGSATTTFNTSIHPKTSSNQPATTSPLPKFSPNAMHTPFNSFRGRQPPEDLPQSFTPSNTFGFSSSNSIINDPCETLFDLAFGNTKPGNTNMTSQQMLSSFSGSTTPYMPSNSFKPMPVFNDFDNADMFAPPTQPRGSGGGGMRRFTQPKGRRR